MKERPILYSAPMVRTHVGASEAVIEYSHLKVARDKSKSEAGVLLAQRWILFTLRSRKFFSVGDMNREIGILLEKLNSRPFQKLPGSRFSKWLELERPALLPLPAKRYEFADWGKVRVAQDYHVCVDRHFYSVPYQLKG